MSEQYENYYKAFVEPARLPQLRLKHTQLQSTLYGQSA